MTARSRARLATVAGALAFLLVALAVWRYFLSESELAGYRIPGSVHDSLIVDDSGTERTGFAATRTNS